MFRTFEEVEAHVLTQGVQKRVALCGSHDDAALAALIDARRKGVVSSAVLIGDSALTAELLGKLGENPADYELIDELSETKAARLALKQVAAGEADIPMKGLVQTQSFLAAIMNPLLGMLPEEGLLSHTMLFYYPDSNRLIFATDCALNISPTLDEKIKEIHNAAAVAWAFGLSPLRVAALSAAEQVNPFMQSSLDAEALAALTWDDDLIMQGPLALDNALNAEAARHKGIGGEVAGQADILLMPDLCAGNIFYKSVHYLGHLPSAGVLCGANAPAIFSSRSDTPQTKYHSILTAVLLSQR